MRQKNKVVSLVIILSMLFSTGLTAFAQLSDIDTHWAREEVAYMVDRNVLSGYPDGTFKPNNNISKVEFYKIINKLLGYEEMANVEFKDVASTEWFYEDVAKGIKAGYLTDGEFLNPKELITREEVARIIGFTFKLIENPQPASSFKDYTLISVNTIGFIGALKEKGFISGFPDGSFGPQNNITRAEVVKMLYNILIAEGLPKEELPKKADLTAYEKALAAVKKADYTESSWKAYQKVVDANKVTENNIQEEVDAATAAIKAAQKDLVKKITSSGGGSSGGGYEPRPPQKADLSKYLAALGAVKEADYTAESWAAYQVVVKANKVTENDTQARVEAATAAIKAAQKNLERIEEPEEPVDPDPEVDKTALEAKIAEAEELYADDYTEESWANLQVVLEAAISVRDNDDATQAEINEAIADLTAAIEGLLEKEEPVDPEEPEVNREALIAKIEEAHELNEKDYTEESWANLQDVLDEAIAVRDNEEATQEEVEQALEALENAIAGLVEKPEEPEEPVITNVQPTEDVTLKAGDTLTISFNAPTGGKGYYRILLPSEVMQSGNIGIPMNEESLGFYSGIWTVPEGLEATNLGVGVVYVAIDGTRIDETAEGKITVILEEEPEVPVVDKTVLREKIAEAETKVEGDYTPESWAPFEAVLTAAIVVNADEKATQEEVDEALAELIAAIEGLVEKEKPVDPEPEVDKTELSAKILEAQGLNEDDYTEGSWANLQTALEVAIAVNEDTEATQEEVNQALSALVDAIEALVETEQSVEEALAEAITEVEQLNKTNYRPETWVDLWIALIEAKKAIRNPESTEEQLILALEELQDGRDGLLPITTAPAEATIIATYYPNIIPTTGRVSIQIANLENARKFTVIYHPADDKETGMENLRKTELTNIGTQSGNIWYNPAQYNTVEVSIYNAYNEYICTFTNVVFK